MNPLKRIIKFAVPHVKFLYGSIFFNILYSILSIFSIMAMLPILNMIFKTDYQKITEKPVYSGNLVESFDYLKNSLMFFIQNEISFRGAISVLATLCAVVALAFFLKNLTRYLGAFLLVNFRIGVTKDLRTAVYNKFLKLPVSFFTEQRKGDMLSRISNDVTNLEGSVMSALVDFINAPFMIVASLVFLFLLSPSLTLFSLIVFPIMGFVINLVGKSLKREAMNAQMELGNLFSLVEETLRSSKVIKIFNADKILLNRFNTTTENWKNFSISMSRRRELASPASEFLGSVTILIITWFAGVQILEKQTMDAVSFIAFIAAFYQILDPAKKLSASVAGIQSGTPSLQRIFEVLDFDLKIEEIKNPIYIKDLHSQIEFKNVNFGYNSDRKIIENFSLIIPKGRTVALVGQSGSGKTTIANLLARFYDVNSGEILIDGINVKDLKINSFRKLLGMVTQESVLFNDSVFNNILMGNPDAAREEVETAAKIANAHEFILNLENGYQTNIGDDGGKLSGGQRQRVSIARAVLKNPPIMILDEATSALDTESERAVQIALENMMQNRTSLVIAHRLSTIQKADRIVVLEQGKICEQGTHGELISQNGVYKKLVELQDFT